MDYGLFALGITGVHTKKNMEIIEDGTCSLHMSLLGTSCVGHRRSYELKPGLLLLRSRLLGVASIGNRRKQVFVADDQKS